jgi:hypothetical protein
MNLKRASVAIVLGTAIAACSSGLGGSEWLWCKEHLASVDEAADRLQVPKAPTSLQEPTWWADYVTSTTNSNSALISGNPDFIASCDVAATKRGVGASRVSWCMSDGIAEAWDAAIALDLMVDMEAETFAYKALPLGQRLDDADFERACRAAFASRTN